MVNDDIVVGCRLNYAAMAMVVADGGGGGGNGGSVYLLFFDESVPFND